jgi:large subunit ribosomal protein L11
MAKKIKAKIKLQMPAGAATPAPPVGPVLAQQGVNIGAFCKEFNDASRSQQGWILPVEITVFEDNSYKFKLKSPLASELIKKALGIEKGSGEPNRKKIGKITRKQLKEIAEKKIDDLNTDDINQAVKIIEGTAKNMGLEVVD